MEVRTLSRRGLLLITTVLSVFVVGMATAYACIIAQGKYVVDNPATSGDVNVAGDPGNGSLFMQWCKDPELTPEQVTPGNPVNISVSPTTDCSDDLQGGSTIGVQDGDNELPPGLYVVTFTNHAFAENGTNTGTYGDYELNNNNDCMAIPPFAVANAAQNNFSVVGALKVDENGNGSTQVTIPEHAHASPSGEAAGLCVTQAAGAYAGVPLLGSSLNDHVLDDQGDPGNGISDERDKGGPPIGNFVPVEVTQDGTLAPHDH